MSERNMIINSSANSKHERACTAGYEGLYVTAISQSRGKRGHGHYAYTKFKIFVLAIFPDYTLLRFQKII